MRRVKIDCPSVLLSNMIMVILFLKSVEFESINSLIVKVYLLLKIEIWFHTSIYLICFIMINVV